MKIGRNDPCPCGCGKKFKVCLNSKRDEAHAKEQERRRTERFEDLDRCKSYDEICAIMAAVGTLKIQ